MTNNTKSRVGKAYRDAVDHVAEALGDDVAADIEDCLQFMIDSERRLRKQNRELKVRLGLDPEKAVGA